MEGFFTHEETAVAPVVRSIRGCGACGLHKTCLSSKMEARGTGSNGIMVLVPSPNASEDKTNGRQHGDKLLMQMMRKHGINMHDCRKVFAVRCRPTGDSDPTDEQIDYCRPDVWREIEKMKPKVILAVGLPALKSLINHRMQGGIGEMSKWRGWVIPDRETNCWIVPILTPQEVAMNMQNNGAYETITIKDIGKAVSASRQPFPHFKEEKDQVEILHNERDVVRLLREMCKRDWEEFAFDYEATGLKPHAKGHKILCCGIKSAYDEKAYSWLWPQDPDHVIRRWWRKLMLDHSVLKIAQNLKYEDLWTNVICGHGVNGWKHDTMLVSHILDNRRGVTGLKFQSYVHFGLLGYEDSMRPYIRSSEADEDKYGANAFNRMEEAPKEDMLLYVGIDALTEWNLYKLQLKLLEELEDDASKYRGRR